MDTVCKMTDMPELPEVETIKRQLDAKLKGETVRRITLLKAGRENPHGKLFVKAVEGKTIAKMDRRAKLIVWRFDDGTGLTTHLRMTGKLMFVDGDYEPNKHDRMLFEIGPYRLAWADVRQFGHMNYLDGSELQKALDKYGPEPLEMEPEDIAELLKGPKTRNIKAALLDQMKLAGIGNIYADETLFRAKLKPTHKLGALTAKHRLDIAKRIQEILKESIEAKGTSSQDYRDSNGEKGGFAAFLNVYKRKGEPCRVCGTPIVRTVIAQRGTHYCPKCQK